MTRPFTYLLYRNTRVVSQPRGSPLLEAETVEPKRKLSSPTLERRISACPGYKETRSYELGKWLFLGRKW